jgi:hypothetical protein
MACVLVLNLLGCVSIGCGRLMYEDSFRVLHKLKAALMDLLQFAYLVFGSWCV